MRICALIIVLILPIVSYTQETIRIKKYKEYEGGTPYPRHIEIYYVLKSDTNFMQGSYILKAGRRKLIEGWYKNNLKDSMWIYKPTGAYNNYVRAKGYYNNDKKVGVWNYSNKKGTEQIYNYSLDSLIFTTQEIKDTIIPVKTDSGFVFMHVDTPPIFIEGESAKKNYLDYANFYFGYNLPKNVWITATIQFVVDTNGNTHDYKIIQGDYPEYNENALKRVKGLPNCWIPAKIDNQLVTSIWTITFKNQYIMR